MSYDLTQLLNLQPAEKWVIIDALCDSLSEDEQFVLTPDFEAELERRRKEHRLNPENVYTWDEVCDHIRNRHA